MEWEENACVPSGDQARRPLDSQARFFFSTIYYKNKTKKHKLFHVFFLFLDYGYICKDEWTFNGV